MKRCRIVLAALILGAGGIMAEELRVDLTQPLQLEVTETPEADGQRVRLQSSLALLPTAGMDFSLEVVFSLDKFQHYAHWTVGLSDASGLGMIELACSMGDDRVPRANFKIQEAPGIVTELPGYDAMTPGVYKWQLVYRKERSELQLTLRDGEGRKVYSADTIPLKGSLDFDRLTLSVTANADRRSELSHRPEEGTIFFRSYVGHEDWYAYLIEGKITSVTMKTRN